ncbi:MAG: rRNA maturation RNase YbeY [Caulobacteraceae bacterium]
MIEVEVAAPAWLNALPDAAGIAVEAGGLAAASDAALAILLTDDEAVAALNARFRGRPSATNVLAFPATANREAHLGDVALAFGVCAAEAAAQGKTLADHLRHLVVHGVLHLIGYDHEEDAAAIRMEARERALLAALGVADPYDVGEHVQHPQ